MTWGFCAVCDRRYPIRQRGMLNDRQAAWFPIQHPQLGDDTGGKECPGVKRAI